MDANLDSFETHVFLCIRRVLHSVERYSRLLLEDHGFSGPQLAVIRELDQRSPASPTQLSQRLEIGPPTLAGILKRLEQRRLVSRRRDPRDLRTHALQLTPDGRELADKAPPLLEQTFREQLRGLSLAEQMQFTLLLDRLAEMMNLSEAEQLRVFDPEMRAAAVDPIPVGPAPKGLESPESHAAGPGSHEVASCDAGPSVELDWAIEPAADSMEMAAAIGQALLADEESPVTRVDSAEIL